RDDTWQPAVSRLAAGSSLVIMDLRAFTSDNKCCIFELRLLVHEVPLQRVPLLSDQTTDEPLLRDTLADLWRRVNPQSPNTGPDQRIRFMFPATGYSRAAPSLVELA